MFVIQGYCGVAAVDAAHQIIIDAQAHGTGSEQELLLGAVTATQTHARPYNCIHNGLISTKFCGTQRDWMPCEHRAKCLRTTSLLNTTGRALACC